MRLFLMIPTAFSTALVIVCLRSNQEPDRPYTLIIMGLALIACVLGAGLLHVANAIGERVP